MLRKIAFALVVGALLWIGVRAIVGAFASDEDRITARLEAACEGFGATRMNPILEFLAPTFVDETSGFRREDVRGAIASAFFGERDPETKAFPYRASVVPDSLVIQVARPAAETAEIAFKIRITDTRGGAERVAWEFGLRGTLTNAESGWQLVRATHDTASGSWKLR
ncbi:MAG: hypothetical protein JNL28_11850 [Planctomycetes bacterium]|nr:hypothetical protein [Planctomycetota bacterium]